MRFLFLKQYAPPDPSPTSRLMGEPIKHPRAAGHEVETVSQASAYQGHHGKNDSRMRRELRAMGVIFRAGLRARVGGRRPDLIVSLSSPPCLLGVAAVIAFCRRVALAHWAMDLYPELAVTLGEIPAGSPATRLLRRLMGWAYRRCVLIVALDDDMAARLQKSYNVTPQVLPPWPAATILGDRSAGSEPSPEKEQAGRRWGELDSRKRAHSDVLDGLAQGDVSITILGTGENTNHRLPVTTWT